MSGDHVRVEGMEEVLGNLNREIKGIEGRTRAGLWAGGLIIMRASMENVPVEYGNLRASHYVRSDSGFEQDRGRGFDPSQQNQISQTDLGENYVEVGNSAAYAVYVHENTEQKLRGQPRPSGLGTYWNPGGPKFFQRAIAEKMQRVIRAVQAYAKIPGGGA